MTPAIKMLIGDWYVDELGILTREIRARDSAPPSPQQRRQLGDVPPRCAAPRRVIAMALAEGILN